jgi:hypothetical protein
MFGMKQRKRKREMMRRQRQAERAARGPQGGTAAAYAAAVDLTPVEQQVKRNADKRARPREQKNNRTDATHDTPPVSSASRRAGRKD